MYKKRDEKFKECQVGISKKQVNILKKQNWIIGIQTSILAFSIFASLWIGISDINSQKQLNQPDFRFAGQQSCPEKIEFYSYDNTANRNLVFNLINVGKSTGDLLFATVGNNTLFRIPGEKDCKDFDAVCSYAVGTQANEQYQFSANMKVVNQSQNISFTVSWACMNEFCVPKYGKIICNYTLVIEPKEVAHLMTVYKLVG